MMVRESGMVVWTPKDSQVGVHTIRVSVYDRYEESTISFKIEVSEAEGNNLGLIIGIVVGVLVLIIVALLLYIFVIKGKGEENRETEDEEVKKMLEEMEQKKREKDWEEAHSKVSNHQVVSDVLLTASDADSQVMGGIPKSYGELYGQLAHYNVEELTTDERKDKLKNFKEE
jgi:mannitol-specific phosphotransferase system IIBC component